MGKIRSRKFKTDDGQYYGRTRHSQMGKDKPLHTRQTTKYLLSTTISEVELCQVDGLTQKTSK